jgi:hypothetical protein
MKKVDLVLALDCSASMQPCFDGLVNHLERLVQPLQGFSLRLGFVAMCASKNKLNAKTVVYPLYSLAGPNMDTLDAIYRGSPQRGKPLFTSDPALLIREIRKVTPECDEDLLVLLDTAADFPFEPVGASRRVVAMFSDEPVETGLNPDLSRIGELSQKYMARRIKLFAALPHSPAADELSAINGCEIECVDGGDGLQNVDFAKLLGAMAKSISISTQQSTAPESYKRALFSQDQWVLGGEAAGGR